MLATSLIDFLSARRTDCNNRFATARRLWPRLDAEDFSCFLREQVSPLAAALDSTVPGQVQVVLNQAYNLGLRLVAEKLAGPSATNPSINLLWTGLFPRIPALVAESPRRVLVALGNAAHQLAATPDTHMEIWRSRLEELAPKCADVEELLVVTQLLAWRAGLSQYRATALAAADSLRSALALEVLDAPDGSTWPEVRDAHLVDPWFGYDSTGTRLTHSALSRRTGAFRGFGGLFLTPPMAAVSGLHVLVFSGGDAWVLVADAFGSTFHRAAPEEIAAAGIPANTVKKDGTLVRTSAQSHTIEVGPSLSN